MYNRNSKKKLQKIKMLLADDLNQLLDMLPKFIRDTIQNHPSREQLIEIVLDIGLRPETRFYFLIVRNTCAIVQ